MRGLVIRESAAGVRGQLQLRNVAHILLAVVLLHAVSGCGSSGSSDGAPTAGSSSGLTLRALWQQGGAAVAAGSPIADAAFGRDIPSAVETVRIIFRSSAGSGVTPDGVASCCIAIDAAAAEADESLREVVLGNLVPGSATVEIAGFLAASVPNDGVPAKCEGANGSAIGFPCSPASARTSPSYDSGSVGVTISSGQRTDAGEIEISALPFIVDGTLMPPAGNIDLPVAFTVADAFGVVESSVTLQVGGVSPNPNLTTEPCDDGDSSIPSCTTKNVDVRGFRVQAEPLSIVGQATTAMISARGAADESTGGSGERPFSFSYVLGSGSACGDGIVTGSEQCELDSHCLVSEACVQCLCLGEGELRFTLQWDPAVDLDLHVTDPAGEEILFSHPTSVSGGELDQDDICIPGVENIFWRQGPPSGTYRVEVDRFNTCSGGAVTSVPFRLEIVVDGEVVESHTGVASDEGTCGNGCGPCECTFVTNFTFSAVPIPEPTVPSPQPPTRTPGSPTGSLAEACDADCETALQVCGSGPFFDSYDSVGECASECVDLAEDFASDASDFDACLDAQTAYIECCTRVGECPHPDDLQCGPEFDAADAVCGDFPGCPLVFF